MFFCRMHFREIGLHMQEASEQFKPPNSYRLIDSTLQVLALDCDQICSDENNMCMAYLKSTLLKVCVLRTVIVLRTWNSTESGRSHHDS